MRPATILLALLALFGLVTACGDNTPGRPLTFGIEGVMLRVGDDTTVTARRGTTVVTAVTWESADPAIATVTPGEPGSATITALATGQTTVTARLGKQSAELVVIVTNATVQSIAITPPGPTVAAGTSTQLVATATLSDGTTADISTVASWSSSETGIATVDDTGEVTGVVVGSARISAALAGVTASVTLTVTGADLVAIEVTPATPQLARGTTQQLAATGRFSDATTQDLTSFVTWSSATTSVATVASTGIVTAVDPGTSVITAAYGAISGTATVTVTAATLASIDVTPVTPELPDGLAQQFTATGRFTDATTQDLTTQVTWASSTPATATISTGGLATAQAPGTTTISATSGAIVGTTVLTVTDAVLQTIEVTPPDPSIANGLAQQFTATGTYSDASTQDLTTTVTWSSDTPATATISNADGSRGLATSASVGTTLVTATLGAISGTTNLTVTAATLVSIQVTPIAPSIADGTTQQFTATGTFTDASTQDLTATVTWLSEDALVATISNAAATKGLATSHAPGATTITAMAGAIFGTTTLTVTAATLVSIQVTPIDPSIADGLTQQFTATGTYTDASTQDLTTTVTWASTTLATATISNADGSRGLATAEDPGTTTITATSGAIAGSTMLTVTPAVLVSIAVTPPSPTIADGTTQQFTATGTYSDTTTQDLTQTVLWASDDTNVATISNADGTRGLATGANLGSVTISATSGAIVGSATLTVTAAELVSIGVTPADVTIADGLVQPYTAIGTFTDASTADLTDSVTWSSLDTAVAQISNAAGSAGEATALAPGSTTIRATSGTIVGSTSLTVTAAVLVALQVTPVNPSIADGLTQQFTATGTYSDTSTQDLTTSVTWASGTPATATISNAPGSEGRATSAAPGTTLISATSGAITGSTTLTVTPAVLVAIAVTPVNPSIPDGLAQQFTATGTFSDTTIQDLTDSVTWTSGTPATATISNAAGSEGLATAADPGTTTITATSGAIAGATTLTVTSAALVSIQVTPVNPSIADGLAQQFTATGTFTDTTTANLTTSVTWSSGTPATATISNAAGTEGLATSANPGTTVITATSGTITGATTLTVTPAELVAITVTPDDASIALGNDQQYVATGLYTDGSTPTITDSVTWTSTDGTVAQISNAAGSEGLATSTGAGATTITATSGAIVGTTTLTVTTATLVSITVTPVNASIADGTTLQYTATGTYSDTSTADLTASVTWASSDETVALVSNASGDEGLATSLDPGTATISATSGAIVGSTSLTVTPAVLVSIAVTPANDSIADGLTVQYTAVGTYSDTSTQVLTTSVTWASSAAGVAQISNAGGSEGLATGVAPGATTISATSGAIVGSTGLTVTAATVVSIAVTPAAPAISTGGTVQLVATATYSDTTTGDVSATATWSTLAAGTATVSATGLVTGVAAGDAEIRATLGAVFGATTVTVAAAAPTVVSTVPADAATNVSSMAAMSITFSAAMNFGNLTTQSVAGACTGSIQVSRDDFATCIPLTTPAPSVGDTVATFSAAPALAFGTTYKLRVTTAATSTAGAALANPFTQATGFTTALDATCATGLVISQVYGGGGNVGATFNADFIELHNPTDAGISLNGLAVQYASSAGTTWFNRALPNVTLAAGGYFLVRMTAPGTNGAALPTPDLLAATQDMSATNGKVALTNITTALPSVSCPTANVIDFVGYGSANCFEGTAAASAGSATAAPTRRNQGCADVGQSSTDFTAAVPAPRNTGTPAQVCACSVNEANLAAEVDFCNLQHPPSTSAIGGATTETIYGRVFQDGVTQPADGNPVVRAEVGIGPRATNPQNEAGWSWFAAAFNVQIANDDEYQRTLVAPLLPGAYAYTTRFSLDGINWTYCDLDGAGANAGLSFDPVRLGTLTVTP